MKIILDTDACPAIDMIYELAKHENIKLIIVSDYHHEFDYKDVEHIAVPAGENATDFKILSILEEDDIVVTQDYALAAMVLAKNARAINLSGKNYNDENIDGLLATRHIFKTARRKGERIRGKKSHKRYESEDVNLISGIKKLLKNKNFNKDIC